MEIAILIVGDCFSLPEGLAATERVRCYARGLQGNGASVGFLCIAPSFLPGREPPWAAAEGEVEGAPFIYVDGTPTESASFLLRQIRKLARPFRFLILALNQAKELGGIDLIHYYGESSRWVMWSKLAAIMTRAKLSQELCELPRANLEQTYPNRLSCWIFGRFALKCPDCVVAISTQLEEWAKGHVRGNAAVIRIPVMAISSRFQVELPLPRKERTVAFSGNLGHEGEAKGLLRAFGQLLTKMPDARLMVTGSTGLNERWGSPRAYACDLGLNGNVDFRGMLQRDDLPALYASVAVLLLPRERGVSSAMSLPTKLAEYMMACTPVLATAVGDIPLYVRDGWNGYLAPPGDENAFAERLVQILTHPEEAALVARRGRETAFEKFECTKACKAIVDKLNRW